MVPIACAAASAAGIPSMCVSNFSWDYIFAEYVIVAGAHHRSLIWQVSTGAALRPTGALIERFGSISQPTTWAPQVFQV